MFSMHYKISLFDLKWHWNDLGVILHLCHIKTIQLCAKFYEAASNGCIWGSTWNITLRFLLNKLMFQGVCLCGEFEQKRVLTIFLEIYFTGDLCPYTWGVLWWYFRKNDCDVPRHPRNGVNRNINILSTAVPYGHNPNMGWTETNKYI